MLSRLTPKVSSWPILSQLSAIGGLAIHDWATFNSAPIHLGTLLALSVLLFSLALQVRLSSALFSALIFPALMLTELRIDGLRPASIEIPIFGILTSAAFFLMLIGFTSLKMDDEERQKETAELRTLPKGRGYWRHVGTTRMGFYVTRRETDFLNRVLNDDHYKLLLDIGAGGGRLEPYLLSFAEHVVATDIRLEDLRDVDANARLDRVLVDASPGLPFETSLLMWL